MKYTIPCCIRGLGLQLATLCVAVAVSPNVPAKELKFEQVFSVLGEPGTLHYQVDFTANGAKHRLEVWRDGDRRVKRRTDEAIETYAFHKPGDPEFRMFILDLKKRIHTQVDRTNLYRIGNFTDWFDLTHGLKQPLGEYQIAKAKGPSDAPKTIEACQWYELTQGTGTTHICWSAQSRAPLMIEMPDGKVVWRVVALDRKPIPSKLFEIHDEGFIRNDANKDIDND